MIAQVPVVDEVARTLDWPVGALLVRLVVLGALAALVATTWSAGLRVAWVRGLDPDRRLAAINAPLRALLALAVLLLAMHPLFVASPAKAAALGAVLLLGASIWGFRELQNVVAGVTLSITRPFRIGLEIEGAGQRGEVVRIGLTRVRIRRADGDLADLPTRALTAGGVRLPAHGCRALPISVEVAPPGLPPAEAVASLTDQVLLSTYVDVAAPVHVTLLDADRARVDATPGRADEAPLLAGDIRARAASLGRTDLLP